MRWTSWSSRATPISGSSGCDRSTRRSSSARLASLCLWRRFIAIPDWFRSPRRLGREGDLPALPASARLSIRLLVTLATIVGASAVQAEDYPSRPVHIVVPYAAGGGTDAMARFIARGLEKKLGQPVIVDNRPGQGTAVGGTYVARAAPDGYTLLMATSSTLAM